mmetsp:Transcript_1073/g.2643  ORF Transcript_1073/g.2643 Transcript_1073/m.2643 type:complete len:287 (-) Transcript_1073:1974-2834(-)
MTRKNSDIASSDDANSGLIGTSRGGGGGGGGSGSSSSFGNIAMIAAKIEEIISSSTGNTRKNAPTKTVMARPMARPTKSAVRARSSSAPAEPLGSRPGTSWVVSPKSDAATVTMRAHAKVETAAAVSMRLKSSTAYGRYSVTIAYRKLAARMRLACRAGAREGRVRQRDSTNLRASTTASNHCLSPPYTSIIGDMRRLGAMMVRRRFRPISRGGSRRKPRLTTALSARRCTSEDAIDTTGTPMASTEARFSVTIFGWKVPHPSLTITTAIAPAACSRRTLTAEDSC